MAKEVTYIQAKLVKRTGAGMVTWIPAEHAIVGKVLDLRSRWGAKKNRNRVGDFNADPTTEILTPWDKEWTVQEAYPGVQMVESMLNLYSSDYRSHKSGSDAYRETED